MSRRWLVALLCGAIATVASACGVPSTPSPIPISRVPYDLLSPSPAATARSTSPAERGPYVYLVDAEDRLVPLEADQGDDVLPADTVASVLTRLAAGPSEEQRRDGLSSAFGPEVEVSLRSLEAGRAEVAIATGTPGPSAGRLPLAVGQVVLSVTSVAGVTSVVLVDDGGRPIDAPLPGGARTDLPLTRQDYEGLIRPGTG